MPHQMTLRRVRSLGGAATRQRHHRIMSDESPDLCEWRNRNGHPGRSCSLKEQRPQANSAIMTMTMAKASP
jgi:hypothetical protein